ncbi:c-type cytochrome biogenesis protein CcsB [Asanoa siamensis]|uniref:C-type cytochrome biogenesis protein CcsB n=1 Tax=Asanoa siamensis TaxID=926357 RepID=A0ABQ4D2S4_9ACTN|nr:c-type cytochrome biogenesis protein CcsB [Asanoa siamensis]
MDLGTLASASDSLMMLAVVGYLAATTLHALEVGLAAPRRQAVLATTGPPSDVDVDVDVDVDRNAGPNARIAGTAAVAVTAVAFVVHAGAVGTRAAAAERVPWANMYEFILVTTLAGAAVWLVALVRRPAIRPLGLFGVLALTLLLGGAGRVHVRVAPLVPALDSPWLKIHVAAAAFSAGLFLVGFVTASLYVLRLRHDAATAAARPTGLAIAGMPEAAILNRLTFRLHAIAFPLWTFAIICGAIWAEAAWGRYWG